MLPGSSQRKISNQATAEHTMKKRSEETIVDQSHFTSHIIWDIKFGQDVEVVATTAANLATPQQLLLKLSLLPVKWLNFLSHCVFKMFKLVCHVPCSTSWNPTKFLLAPLGKNHEHLLHCTQAAACGLLLEGVDSPVSDVDCLIFLQFLGELSKISLHLFLLAVLMLGQHHPETDSHHLQWWQGWIHFHRWLLHSSHQKLISESRAPLNLLLNWFTIDID